KCSVASMARPLGATLAAASVLLLSHAASADSFRLSRDFNKAGNVLIADQFNNRVIEVGAAGNILWSFGLGPRDFSARSIIGVNDAQRVGPFTLMAGTGNPCGGHPGGPQRRSR